MRILPVLLHNATQNNEHEHHRYRILQEYCTWWQDYWRLNSYCVVSCPVCCASLSYLATIQPQPSSLSCNSCCCFSFCLYAMVLLNTITTFYRSRALCDALQVVFWTWILPRSGNWPRHLLHLLRAISTRTGAYIENNDNDTGLPRSGHWPRHLLVRS